MERSQATVGAFTEISMGYPVELRGLEEVRNKIKARQDEEGRR